MYPFKALPKRLVFQTPTIFQPPLKNTATVFPQRSIAKNILKSHDITKQRANACFALALYYKGQNGSNLDRTFATRLEFIPRNFRCRAKSTIGQNICKVKTNKFCAGSQICFHVYPSFILTHQIHFGEPKVHRRRYSQVLCREHQTPQPLHPIHHWEHR